MMKNYSLLLALVLSAFSAKSQTWSDDVAEIFYEKCTKCHHQGGLAPFSLTQYSEVSSMAAAIYDAVNDEVMPPWPPDNDYQQYAHNRALSESEKSTILNWLDFGLIEGNAANTPPPPVYNIGSLLGPGDLELQIPTHTSTASAGSDDYSCYAIPNGLTAGRKIKAIEIIPGNREIVHHCLIYVDPSNTATTNTSGSCGSPNSANAILLMGYTPGSSPLTLPSSNSFKLGMDMPANSTIIFALHYPDGSGGEQDSTKVIFHFYPIGETGIRNVYADAFLENWSFALPPGQSTNVTAQFPPSGGVPSNYSVLSVFPHMHLLGESMKVYGIKPNLDTLKLINVPEWDFHWQDFYFFKNIQVANAGTSLRLEATYNNTTGSMVLPGLNTTDEMCLAYMHYMPYMPGDELIDMEELMNNETSSILELQHEMRGVKIAPNPFSESIEITLEQLKQGDALQIRVYDFTGKLVKTLVATSSFDLESLIWDGTNDLNQEVSNGMYYLSIRHNDELISAPMVKN